MEKGQNTFVGLLDLLKVKHTKVFSNKYFNEHPHKYNLFGLSEMLSDYGIKNAATRIEDKENDIFNIECPFVAHFGSDFVAVNKIESDKVDYLRNGKKLSIPVSNFIKSWSGIILLAEVLPDSGEPDYTSHRKKDLFYIAQQSILAIAGLLMLAIAYINHTLFADLGFTLLLSVNLVGIFVCYMLVLKQLHVQSQYVDKICTLFSQSDCNNVLESDASKLFGVFSWSEIGLGYFVANMVVLLFLPHLIPWLVIINILTLPYTVWSVWYQKVKAQQWCPLCLAVQALLWVIFIINCLFGYIQITDLLNYQLSIINYQLLAVGCIFVIPIFALNLLLSKLSEGSQVADIRQEINSVKANEDVFRTLLVQQPYYEVTEADSQILFGNPDAALKITILTNPFCNPCSKMHKRMEHLLKETKGNICVRYIFSSFNENLEYANRYFNAIYFEKGPAIAWQLYTDWFENGKVQEESFFHDLQLDLNNPAIEIEFAKHESWKEKTKLRATPTIIVNGYKLPDSYKIEDLRHFTEYNIDIK